MKTASQTPILDTFNKVGGSVIQWCTPSIHMEVPRVQDIYSNDISVSYHSLGNPCTNTGIFFKSHTLAAQAFGADHTLFSVNGTTGSNFVVLRALKHQLGKVKILAQRNVHKSITTAAEDYHIDISYLQPHYNDTLQIFIPNTINEILEEVKKQKPNVLLISNPTYEGLSIYLPELVQKVRKIKKDIIVFIDEAWGAHFPFSDKLPVSAMQADADICVQSTHKQGSGLQQTAMIHWKDGNINYDCLLESYKSLMTTSPSYHLLASLDAARFFMAERGKEVIDNAIERARYMRKQLNLIPHLHAYEPRELIRVAHSKRLQVDPTKILIHLDGYSGMQLAENLELNHNIVVEKYESQNVFLIMKLQNYQYEIDQTIQAIKKEVLALKADTVANFPLFPNTIEKKLAAYKIGSNIEIISLNKHAIGKIVAENIVPYPPGIPLIAKGEVFNEEHLAYLNALRKTNGLISVIMNDSKVKTIKVVKG